MLLNEQELLRPLYLVPDCSVDVQYDDTFEAPAGVGKKGDKQFVIKVNRKMSMNMWAASILYNKVPFDHFMAGLMFHEVAHILYESHSIAPKEQTGLMQYIYNVLLDAQIEYNLSKDYPETAKYIRYVLLGLRRDTDDKVLSKIKGGEQIIKLKDTFFYLVRFGVVLKDSSSDFVNFLVPLLLSAMRNKVQNVVTASEAVYEYLFAEADSSELQQVMSKLAVGRVSMTQEDLDALDSAEEQMLVSDLKEALEELQQQVQTNQNRKAIGREDRKVLLEEKDDPFYRTTIQKHKAKIMLIRSAFQRKMNEVIDVPAYDGELDMQYQQRAYINSFSGDEEDIYTIPVLADHSIDIVLIRDISGSTGGIHVEYAEACVMLHASIQGVFNIRTAHIDFSDDAVTLLEFDAPLREARIHPRVDGGTYIRPAYELALKMNWKGKKKAIHVITDGGIGGKYDDLEAQLNKRGVSIVKWHLGTYAYDKKLRLTSIEKFHYDIANYILKEL
jgi:hypothetical protein